jgi:hypothetical protein
MGTANLTEMVCEIVARVMEQPSVAVRDRLEVLGCDELDRVTIASEVEKKFGSDLAPFDEAEATSSTQRWPCGATSRA